MIRKDEHYQMRFGKYKGKSLQDILQIDAGYLIWLHYNTKMTLTQDLFQKAMYRNNDTGSNQSVTQKKY